ncbi:hypothetical protein [Streptomyces sp. SID5910]|uniref:hypothetical protein n=1 Tax=Streptomyces sp. SID5910 TaxID=2690312 RepID=UPI00136B1D38|nr:hypothetical protein [Streptomyces sp. SID5910]MYR43069.1 hypothetical protein [Streptomyces sp. SID5910]
MAIIGNLLPENAESVETDASAWSALVNATGLARGNGGTAGSFCLLFKSASTGDCQVGLATRVAVTAGAEYWGCASIFPPAAGAQSRLEIRWYNSGGTLISTTQGPLITAPSATWHQVAATGVAPAGTATALVVLRVTATATNQSWFADRAYLGVPLLSTGNLLPYNTESVEIDASGWGAQTNAALSISPSSYTWYQALRITANASGSVLVQSQATPAVTPGAEYVGSCNVTPAQAGTTFRVAIQWRAADGSTVSTSTAPWTPATGGWTRCNVVAVAPPGAASARLQISPTATASGQSWVCDRLVLAPTSTLVLPGNLLPYSTASMEQDISGWTVTGATASQSSAQAINGDYALRLVGTGGAITATVTSPVPVVAGVGYQFRPISRQADTRVYRTQVEWLNSNGDPVRTRWQAWGGRPDAWLVSAMGDLAPDEAVSARLSFIIPDASAGDVWYLDSVAFSEGGLTAKAAAAGGGGAAVTVRGLATGGPTWTWSLTRIVGGQAAQPVRGWAGDLTAQTITGDSAVITDYETPLGVPVQWRIRIEAPSGSVGSYSYTSDPITLDADPTSVWLKDPGLPQRSCRVTVGTPMPTWKQDARQSVSTVRGRRLPIVISDARGGRTGDLTVITETVDEVAALDWVLSSGSVLLLQWPPGWGENDMYVSVGDVSAAPIVDFAEFRDRTWVLPLTEVDRPIGGVTGSADRTWQDVKDDGTTWAEALAGASTWLDVYTGA